MMKKIHGSSKENAGMAAALVVAPTGSAAATMEATCFGFAPRTL